MRQRTHGVYRSKIGRLPFAIRQELCARIRDGVPTKRLLDWLNNLPEFEALRASDKVRDISDQNLCDWRRTGYQQWLDAQGRAEQIRNLRDESLRIVEAAGGSAASVGSRIVMGRLLEVLEEASQDDLLHIGALLAKLKAEETREGQLDLASKRAEVERQRLELDQARYQRETCRLFLEWAESAQARAIIDDRGASIDDKTEALGRLMFGDLWRCGAQ